MTPFVFNNPGELNPQVVTPRHPQGIADHRIVTTNGPNVWFVPFETSIMYVLDSKHLLL
jgi:hypothetical protein